MYMNTQSAFTDNSQKVKLTYIFINGQVDT